LNEIWGGSETSPGFDESRIEPADTSYPIILDGYSEGEGFTGGLVDGRHRKIKLQRAGEERANVVRLTSEDIATLVDAAKQKQQMLKQASEDLEQARARLNS
jgi:hypothetical protein